MAEWNCPGQGGWAGATSDLQKRTLLRLGALRQRPRVGGRGAVTTTHTLGTRQLLEATRRLFPDSLCGRHYKNPFTAGPGGNSGPPPMATRVSSMRHPPYARALRKCAPYQYHSHQSPPLLGVPGSSRNLYSCFRLPSAPLHQPAMGKVLHLPEACWGVSINNKGVMIPTLRDVVQTTQDAWGGGGGGGWGGRLCCVQHMLGLP